jgi:RHS repeat-associated protein
LKKCEIYSWEIETSRNASDWADSGVLITASVVKYYAFGSQTVMEKRGDGVIYLSADQISSTSLTTDANGAEVSQVRNDPYGAVRWSSGTLPTDKTFTGQRAEGFGLMDYKARYYSSDLGHFIQADTLIPGAGNPLAWDRYAYVQNNPLIYVDPSGHRACLNKEDCEEQGITPFTREVINNQNRSSVEEENEIRTPVIDYEIGGWQVQFTGVIGYPSNFHKRNGEKFSFLLFYGISFVFDFDGGFQLYGLQRDIKFNPRLEQGPAELKYSTDVLGLGATVASGPIFGEGIKGENGGTTNYEGQAVDYLLGAGPLSIDYYAAFDAKTGATNPNKLHGFDIGYSVGLPFSYGKMATYGIPWMKRQDINLR